MRTTPEITVIIPTWNQAQLLEKCLFSLASQSQPCQVIVVDNASTDSTVETVRQRFEDVQLLALPENLGFAKAVNIGIEKADTEFIALLNNDTEADTHWIEAALTAFLEHPDYGFFASRMVNFRQRDRLDSAGDSYGKTGLPLKRGFGRPLADYEKKEPVMGASAGAAFYRRIIFETVGLFDENYHLYLEDVDLSLRAQFAGYRCLYLPNAIVYHIEAASDSERDLTSPNNIKSFYSSNRVFWITRNRWQLMLTYQPIRNAPFLLYGWIRSFLFHLIKAGFTLDFLRGLAAGILKSRLAFEKRHQIAVNRTISNKEVCHLLDMC